MECGFLWRKDIYIIMFSKKKGDNCKNYPLFCILVNQERKSFYSMYDNESTKKTKAIMAKHKEDFIYE